MKEEISEPKLDELFTELQILTDIEPPKDLWYKLHAMNVKPKLDLSSLLYTALIASGLLYLMVTLLTPGLTFIMILVMAGGFALYCLEESVT